MEEDTSPLPGGAPGSAGNEDGIHLPPGNGVVAEVWGPWLTEPAASPEAPIALYQAMWGGSQATSAGQPWPPC